MQIAIQSDSESQVQGFAAQQMNFDMSKQAKLFHMLSNTLYSDKLSSVIRELCSNAYDSHIMAGTPEAPIVITAPTFGNPVLTISDRGVGLDKEMAFRTILCYLGSNKDQSNDFVGGWGIGSKSPFAYSKNYEVICIKDGWRTHFTCWKDEHGLPSNAVIDEGETDESNGVKMVVPIEAADVRKTWDKIRQYVAWTNYPVEVEGLEGCAKRYPVETIECEGYRLELHEGGEKKCRLVYGGFSYNIEDCLDGEWDVYSKWKNLLGSMVAGYNLAVVFDTPGSLDFNMNREELEHTDRTKKFVIGVVNSLIEMAGTQDTILSANLKEWQDIEVGERTLAKLGEVFTTALASIEAAEGMMARAFRMTEKTVIYHFRQVVPSISYRSGVRPAHQIKLLPAPLKDQIAFFYARIMTVNGKQRGVVYGSERNSRGRHNLFVKAETEEAARQIVAGHPDFAGLDLAQIEFKFIDIPVAPKQPAVYKPGKSPQPRVYCTEQKKYLPWGERTAYVVKEKGFEDVVAICQAAEVETVAFTPTADFLKRYAGQLPNLFTAQEYRDKFFQRSLNRLATGASERFLSDKLYKTAKYIENFSFDVISRTKIGRDVEKLQERITMMGDRYTRYCLPWLTFDQRKIVHELGVPEDTAEKLRADCHAVIAKSKKLRAISQYINLDRIGRDRHKASPELLALIETLEIGEYL